MASSEAYRASKFRRLPSVKVLRMARLLFGSGLLVVFAYNSVGLANHILLHPDPKHPVCPPEEVECQCGLKGNDTIMVYVEKCVYDSTTGPRCDLCKELSLEDVCTKYAQCHECRQGLSRCMKCPNGRHGEWCDYECDCLNGGVCGILDGRCICPSGITGGKCELDNRKMKNTTRSSKRFRRNTIKQSPGVIESQLQCPKPTTPINGEVEIERSPLVPGDAINYRCNENYTLLGTRTRHCMSEGRWATDAPTCEKLCSFPSVGAHVQVQLNPNRPGPPLYDGFGNEVIAELAFSCSTGFTVVGPHRLRCASGVWDQPPPSCLPVSECPDPGIPEHGGRVIQDNKNLGYRVGTTVAYNCIRDYTLIGSRNITCLHRGIWSSSPPICVPSTLSLCTFTCEGRNAPKQADLQRPLVCSSGDRTDQTLVLYPGY